MITIPIPCPIFGLQDAGIIAFWIGVLVSSIGGLILITAGRIREYQLAGLYFLLFGALTIILGFNWLLLVLLGAALFAVAIIIESFLYPKEKYE